MLLDDVREAVAVRRYSPRTAEAYVYWVRRYVLFHGKRHPRDLGVEEVAQFLVALAAQGLSASTRNQALSGLVFLYGEVLGIDVDGLEEVERAKEPRNLPVVLSRAEVGRVLAALSGPSGLACSLMYGGGLRLSECLELRVKDLDLDRAQIFVRRGKGAKDRVTMLPRAVRPRLEAHLAAARLRHEEDLRVGAGWVVLPAELARKRPRSGQEWPYQWVFPAVRGYVDRETGQRRRHHLHETT